MPIDDAIRQRITSGFRFVVSIDDTAVAAFTECTLPTMDIEIEQVKEGGLNTYVHQLPGMRKASQMTLKNGVGVIQDLQSWYLESLGGQVTRKRISVAILNAKLEPVVTLDIAGAFPSQWSGPNLKTDDRAAAIQSLVLACGEVTVR